ncbi:Zinc finger protein 862 [Frankliniella fusca]|uniref:Zinc finger protein 862 n=1 Tax=Frankliniella fusca TaxID=407009 RepID=A0AAE1HHD9_9NEOP|nr:Zinc finger protein 862 [Frankliniella fusca]
MDIDEEEFAVDNPGESWEDEPREKRSRRSTTPVNTRRARGELSSSEKKSLQKPKSFQEKWLHDEKFRNWLQRVPGEPTKAKCSACDVVLKAGKSDLDKHGESAKHAKNVKSVRSNQTVDNMFNKNDAARKHADAVKRAEIQMSAFFAENNIPFLAADQLLKVQKKVLKDSPTVKDMKLGRDKCNAIVRNVIAKVETEELVGILKKNLFCILLDESTDAGNDKAMCVLTVYISPTTGKPTLGLLELLRLDPTDCSAEKLWQAFTGCLEGHGVPVTNVMGMASDSAATFVGCNNSFWTRLKAVCPWAILLPCVCHSVADVSKNACAKLPSLIPEHLRLISGYMSHSLKRSAELKEFQAFYEEELKVLKPSGTRLLVLHNCVQRYQAMQKSLNAFLELRCFQEREKKDKDAHRILADLKNPFTKAYFEFLNYSLNFTNQFNALFQSKNVLIHKVYEKSHSLMKTFCMNFLNDGLADHLGTVNVTHPHNMKNLEDIVFGPECWATLESLVPNNRTPEAEAQLRRDANLRSDRSAWTFTARLPRRFSGVCPSMTRSWKGSRSGPTGMSGIADVAFHYKEKLQLNMTSLACEWRDILNEITGKTREEWSSLPVEEMWVKIKGVTNGLDEPMYPNLAKLADVAMISPHSNADSERCFSIVTDVRSKKRNRMGGECLNAICVTRTAFKAKRIDCVSFEVKKEHLAKHNLSMYGRDDKKD